MNNQTYSQAHIEVQGRPYPGNRIIVEHCPYCGKGHFHGLRQNDSMIRQSDCKPGGQYKIILSQP